MRYMLLHELQHYKHHDAIGSFLMNLAGVVYWFNPFVWYALKKMCNDREVACDTSVLEMLADDAYEDYGTALINFTEKVSLTPFPFAAEENHYQWNASSENISCIDLSVYFGEYEDNTYFFTANIGPESDAAGGNAAEITMSVLSDMNIWKNKKSGKSQIVQSFTRFLFIIRLLLHNTFPILPTSTVVYAMFLCNYLRTVSLD